MNTQPNTTPRTDAEARLVWSEGNQGMGDEYGESVVDADFARKLETECAEMAALLKRAHGYVEGEAPGSELDNEIRAILGKIGGAT